MKYKHEMLKFIVIIGIYIAFQFQACGSNEESSKSEQPKENDNKDIIFSKEMFDNKDPVINYDWDFVGMWVLEHDEDYVGDSVKLHLKRNGIYIAQHSFLGEEKSSFTESGTWILKEPGDPKEIILTILMRDNKNLDPPEKLTLTTVVHRWDWYLNYEGNELCIDHYGVNYNWDFVAKWYHKRDENYTGDSVKLDLKKDGTYNVQHTFLGEEKPSFTESGTWILNEPGDPKEIILTIRMRDNKNLDPPEKLTLLIVTNGINWNLNYEGNELFILDE